LGAGLAALATVMVDPPDAADPLEPEASTASVDVQTSGPSGSLDSQPVSITESAATVAHVIIRLFMGIVLDLKTQILKTGSSMPVM
jgi:hypothetical protein